MKDVDIISKVVARKGEAMASPSKDAASVDLSAYLLKSIWDKCWEIRTTDKGEEYLFGKLPVGLQFDLSSFVDGGLINLPTLYDGLPIDGQTLRWKEVTNEDGSVTRVLESVGGGTGEGNGTISSIAINGTGNAITSVALNEDKTRLTFIKGMNFITSDYLQEYYWNKTEITDKYYSKSYIDENYYKKEEFDGNYVDLTSDQDINGSKNFLGELRVNGNPIVYNAEEGYWMLDGDLLVTGDITSFANEDGYTPSSIMDALRVDGTNLKVIDGVLTFVGSTGGGGGTADSVHWDNIDGKPDLSIYALKSEIPTYDNSATQDWVNEQGFLKSDDIQALTFTNGKFSAVSYDPSMSPCTVNIPTKLSHLEDDSDFVTSGMMSSYATKTWVGQQGFLDSSDLNGYATETWVGNNYLPLTGSLPVSMDGEFKLQGDLRLRDGTEYYGRQLFFGDGDYCYIGELSDDKMTIYGDKGIVIKTTTSSSTKYYIELTTEGIKLNGGLLKYNGSYWEIEGDVLVTGGITSYE